MYHHMGHQDFRGDYRWGMARGRLRLLGAPGCNLERDPISIEEKGGKYIYFGMLCSKMVVAPAFSPVSTPPPGHGPKKVENHWTTVFSNYFDVL